MQIIISPAKKLSSNNSYKNKKCRLPEFREKAKELVNHMQKYSIEDLEKLMHISKNVATLNVGRYKNFHFKEETSTPALFTFAGEVYSGLDAKSLKEDEIDYANKHLSILSGLYGLLRPLDLIEPYRLEMGSKVAINDCKNLYEFWQETLTKRLKETLLKDDNILLNLASNEYSKAIKKSELNCKIISANFKERRNDQLRDIMVYTKKARGLLARFVISNQITQASDLKEFNLENYRYSQANSTINEKEEILTFIR